MGYSSELYFEVEECTSKELLAHALSKMQVPKHVNIIDCTAGEPKMFVDLSRMESVFMILLQNAIEAMPEKGTVEVKSVRNDAHVEITFADTGMGIPENILARVFSPLTTTKAKGMGMGLAICKRIKDVHGGKIAIESVVGEGTRVILRLPIKPQLEFVVEENGVSAFMDEKLEYMHP